MEIKKIRLTKKNLDNLIQMSKNWQQEDISFGYDASKPSYLKNKLILMAYQDNIPIGFLFGKFEKQPKYTTIIPNHSTRFEVEEIYVEKQYRSLGVGQKLFEYLEQLIVEKADYITLSTATKDYKKILHFYIDVLGMTFWNARFYKKIKK